MKRYTEEEIKIKEQQAKESLNTIKRIWANAPLYKKVGFFICVPFLLARDILRGTWKLLTKPLF